MRKIFPSGIILIQTVVLIVIHGQLVLLILMIWRGKKTNLKIVVPHIFNCKDFWIWGSKGVSKGNTSVSINVDNDVLVYL